MQRLVKIVFDLYIAILKHYCWIALLFTVLHISNANCWLLIHTLIPSVYQYHSI